MQCSYALHHTYFAELFVMINVRISDDVKNWNLPIVQKAASIDWLFGLKGDISFHLVTRQCMFAP